MKGRVLLAAASALAMLLAGCGSGGESAVPPAGGATTSPDLLKNAPVADAAAILPGSTMERIKQRGKLIVAEALDAPLLSQQNPSNPDEVTGFDAELAKLLAVYILGKPEVEIVPRPPRPVRPCWRTARSTSCSTPTRSPRSGLSRSRSRGRTSSPAWPWP
jgi:glutamate transport system substrate-binding protein